MERVGHDDIGQNVIPAISQLLKHAPGLSRAPGLAGGQQGRVTLAAGSRYQFEQRRSEAISHKQTAQALELAVAGKGVGLAQYRSPYEQPGQPHPAPCRPGCFGPGQHEPRFRSGRRGQSGYFHRGQMRKRRGAQIAAQFLKKWI